MTEIDLSRAEWRKSSEGYSFDRTCPAQGLALGTFNLAELNPTTSSDDVQLPKLVRSRE